MLTGLEIFGILFYDMYFKLDNKNVNNILNFQLWYFTDLQCSQRKQSAIKFLLFSSIQEQI